MGSVKMNVCRSEGENSMAKIAASTPKTAPARKASQAKSENSAAQQAEIERLAYQFFTERGGEHGHDREDWLRAEAIVRGRSRS
jgi:hypothetical protein